VSNEQVTYVVAGVCAVLALAAYGVFILAPAWTSYSRLRERVGAAFLSIYVLLAMIGVGAGIGLGIAWFWDRIQGSS
jgi:hypothetical protein